MDKLEKHIKQKLEERTITPSKGAWDKIASKVKEQPQRKRNSWFPYAIAASVVGIVFLSVLFFADSNPKMEQTEVVETGTQIESKAQQEVTTVDESGQKVDSQYSDVEIESKIPGKREEPIPEPSTYNLAVANQETEQPLRDEIELNSDTLIAQKVEEVVAQVTLMESLNRDVTDAEVDSLLRAAQRDILTDRLFTNGQSVDASALLAEVEDELDESFRDQIFDALKSGYFKLRTAVADRNK
ncbi:hypothetical protein [Flagellimonas iocasae]|uniref:Anti-sigma factor n=1 Tax=Flagellimonas iocasae TaxID=2055905 RepID=A0ABW4XVH3_9FLAO